LVSSHTASAQAEQTGTVVGWTPDAATLLAGDVHQVAAAQVTWLGIPKHTRWAVRLYSKNG
jgi:hypothetical protein